MKHYSNPPPPKGVTPPPPPGPPAIGYVVKKHRTRKATAKEIKANPGLDGVDIIIHDDIEVLEVSCVVGKVI